MPTTLLDERSRPDFRGTYGALLARATRLDVALTHLRLSTLDLTEAELGRIARVRLLLSRVSAAALDAEVHAVLHRPELAENLRRLILLLERGAIAVRSAPLAGWAPDFSVFGGETGPFALLVGPHRFGVAAFSGPMLASGPRQGRGGAGAAALRGGMGTRVRHRGAGRQHPDPRGEGRKGPVRGVPAVWAGGPKLKGDKSFHERRCPRNRLTPLAARARFCVFPGRRSPARLGDAFRCSSVGRAGDC